MKFVLLMCGAFGCFNYAWFPTKEICQQVADKRQLEVPSASFVCIEKSPNIFERLLQ